MKAKYIVQLVKKSRITPASARPSFGLPGLRPSEQLTSASAANERATLTRYHPSRFAKGEASSDSVFALNPLGPRPKERPKAGFAFAFVDERTFELSELSA